MNAPRAAGRVIVVGSANRDVTVRLARRPEAGETVLASDRAVSVGGKGANQAIAAAGAGAPTALVTCVGPDGGDLLAELRTRGVDLQHVLPSRSATGEAVIMLTTDGENAIVVVPGANGELSAERIAPILGDLLEPGCVLVVQCEIPLEAVAAAVRAAQARGSRVVLNLAPFRDVPPDVLAAADPLVVNGMEAEALVGAPVEDVEAGLAAAAGLAGRARSVVITLGGRGAILASGDQRPLHVPAHVVTVVDTAGAGDAFVGALAASLLEGGMLAGAVEAGSLAGARAVQHRGAQPPPAERETS